MKTAFNSVLSIAIHTISAPFHITISLCVIPAKAGIQKNPLKQMILLKKTYDCAFHILKKLFVFQYITGSPPSRG